MPGLEQKKNKEATGSCKGGGGGGGGGQNETSDWCPRGRCFGCQELVSYYMCMPGVEDFRCAVEKELVGLDGSEDDQKVMLLFHELLGLGDDVEDGYSLAETIYTGPE